MRPFNIATDGLLGGSTISAATRGHITLLVHVQMPRRRIRGGKPTHDDVVIPKQTIIYKPYDDTEDIILIMSIL